MNTTSLSGLTDDFQIHLSDSDLAEPEPEPLDLPNARPGRGRLLALVAQRDKFRADADNAYDRWCALTKGTQAFNRPQALAMQIKSADKALATAEAGFANASRLVRVAVDLWGPVESYETIPGYRDAPESDAPENDPVARHATERAKQTQHRGSATGETRTGATNDADD